MKIIVKPTSSFWFAIVLGTIQLGLAALYITSNSDWGIDNRLLALIWLIVGVVTVYRGAKEYKHSWEIAKTAGGYCITKNGIDVFNGAPSELLAIKRIPDAYLIYPRKGECIEVPQSVADPAILELYHDKKKSEQGVTPNA
jgi:hypothetical protein